MKKWHMFLQGSRPFPPLCINIFLRAGGGEGEGGGGQTVCQCPAEQMARCESREERLSGQSQGRFKLHGQRAKRAPERRQARLCPSSSEVHGVAASGVLVEVPRKLIVGAQRLGCPSDEAGERSIHPPLADERGLCTGSLSLIPAVRGRD